MKMFKWWHKLIMVLAVATIAALFLVVAFKTKDEDVQRWSLFSSMFFGLATICLSLIALAISIDTYRKTNMHEYEKLQNKANEFIIENNDEIDYIPLCIIANIYDRHRKYKRNIYTSFNKLSNEVQVEVLKQLNYRLIDTNNNWLKNSLNRIKNFINEYDFGDPAVIDYYERSLNYSDINYGINDADINIISSKYLGMPSLRFEKGECYDNGITFKHYCALYLSAKIQNDVMIKLVPKPLDELIERAQLNKSEERSICFWSIYVVDVISNLIKENPKMKIKNDLFPKIHAEIVTYEDRFLYSLSGLFDLNQYEVDNK